MRAQTLKFRLLAILVLGADWFQPSSRPELEVGPPDVLKLEPPSWREGHTLNPERVMIRGRNLEGARLAGQDAGLRLGEICVNARGRHLFADIWIRLQAPQPKTVEFEVAPARLADGSRLKDRMGVGPVVRIAGGRMRARLPGRSASIYA